MRLPSRTAAGAALMLALMVGTTPALAHRVVVFAFVDGDEVAVEAKFSTGRVPATGEVVVEDADGAVQSRHALEDGEARFALDREAAAEGLSITVTTGDDHEGYWILTPADIGAPAGAGEPET